MSFKLTTPGRTAEISEDAVYRYALGRNWGDGPRVNWLMLNPSTADHVKDDATLRRCIGYTKSWGHGGLVVTNLFALRSTDPAALVGAVDPVGEHNDDFIVRAAACADLVVCAWGDPPRQRKSRIVHVLALLEPYADKLHCLARTAAGNPGHPLRLRADLAPVPMALKGGNRG
jgi:hypothetical protein